MPIHRIKPESTFQRVYHQGQSISNRLLVLYVARGDERLKPPQVAVVAGKRLGNAVIRNRLRRQLRAITRSLRPMLGQGLRFIIVARRPALGADYWQLQDACQDLLKRASVLLREEP